MTYKLKEVNYSNEDIKDLYRQLDDFQNRVFPERVNYGLSAFNGLEKLKKTFVLYDGNKAIATASLKEIDKNTCELARVVTDQAYRGQGLAEQVILKVIHYAREMGYKKVVLDTWKKSTSAVKLYKKLGFVEKEAMPLSTIKRSFSTENEDTLLQIQKLLVFMEKEI